MLIEDVSIGFKKILPSVIYEFFSRGDKRTISLKRNILGAFFLKGLDTLLGFIRVPLIISFLGVSEYGIWLTLSSVIGWFTFFDIGLSSGLKTKLSGALAEKDFSLAKMYISTTYATITIIISSVFLIFLIVFPFLNWAKILNVPVDITSEVSQFVFVFVSLFALQFVVNILSTVLISDQKPSIAGSLGTLSSALYLLLLILLKLFTEGSLLLLTLACNGTSAVVYILASLYFYKKKYPAIAPDIKSVDFSHFRELATLGVKFFFIQISAIIMFSTDNMIITQLFTPADVAPYSVALKYMSIPLMLFSIITWPLWAAYSDAYTTKDFDWIKKTVKKLLNIWVVIIITTLFCLLISGKFYEVWLRGEIQVPFILSCFMGLYSILVAWNQIFVYFLNGVGKIKLQLIMGVFIIILNIPLSIFFADNLKLGPAGVILATDLCLALGAVWTPIQYHKIITNTASGVWNQ